METLERIIASHSFVQGLEEKYIELIVGCAANVRFEPEQFVCREGEEADNFFLIRHGKIALEIFMPERGATVIETLGENEILGWSWFFPPYRWHFDAKAIELTRAIAFDGKCLRRKCEENHDLGYELAKRFAAMLMERLQATRLRLLDLFHSKGAKLDYWGLT
jgi:CRP-like cAMP-binding protein